MKVSPRASRDEIAGFGPDGVLRVRLAAPPVDGRANEALVHLLAKQLGVSKGAIRLVAGETSRMKRLAIEGLTAEQMSSRLAASGGGKAAKKKNGAGTE